MASVARAIELRAKCRLSDVHTPSTLDIVVREISRGMSGPQSVLQYRRTEEHIPLFIPIQITTFLIDLN